MYSVLIADDNVHWRENLCTVISQDDMFCVVASVSNGKDTIDGIKEFQPDIVILDIVMPDYDGISIVESIKNTMPDYRPIIYVISGMGTNTTIELLSTLDISFYSLKPIALGVVIANLKRLVLRRNAPPETPSVNESSMESLVADTLRGLGLSPHLQSTKYAKEAIIAYLSTPFNTRALTKVIYPDLARANGVTAGAVEKNIRDAVNHVVTSHSGLYNRIFSFYKNKKITNSLFLSAISDYINSASQ